MPWAELGTRFLIGLVGVSIACGFYVAALLWIGGRFNGILKISASLAVYVVMAAGLGLALLFVLASAPEPAIRQNWGYLGIVMALWAAMLAPGFLYIGRFKLAQLRQAGFFLPRSR